MHLEHKPNTIASVKLNSVHNFYYMYILSLIFHELRNIDKVFMLHSSILPKNCYKRHSDGKYTWNSFKAQHLYMINETKDLEHKVSDSISDVIAEFVFLS